MKYHSDLLDVYIFKYLEALDCPRSLACWLMYSNNEHAQLVKLDWKPENYNSLVSARDSFAATKFLSKATFLKTDINLRDIAIDKFQAAEWVCKQTNRRIRESEFENSLTVSCLFSMNRQIANILKTFEPDELIDACNWGPGATTKIKKRDATFPEKFQIESGITRDAHDFVSSWFHLAYPTWNVQFQIENCNKVVTVPKDAKGDRTIAIEPGINLWFQKGIGAMIRNRLSVEGIDLNYQRYNQQKSRIASKFNNLATVDFSAASDTISKDLVESLLPSNWLTLMKVFRSNSGSLDGNILYYEKFSSMGNAFTFELETLIFYSLACVCCSKLGLSHREVSVYGDDVILPSAAFDLYCSISKDLGFTVNQTKSYSTSYFRESCGAYWWNGIDIKPIFQKDALNGTTAILKSCNAIRRLAHSRNTFGCDASLRVVWRFLSDTLGSRCPKISDGYGDLGIIENFDDPSVKVVRAKHGYEGYYVRVFAVQAIMINYDNQGLLLAKLKQIVGGHFDPFTNENEVDVLRPDLSSIGNSIPMPLKSRYAKIRILIPSWHDLGPWI